LCGYLPLAIRLAASRLRSGAVSGVPDLLEELAEPNVRYGRDGVSHGIRAAFELTYRRLTTREQRFFRYLGISPCLHVSGSSAFMTLSVNSLLTDLPATILSRRSGTRWADWLTTTCAA
jgi:hypothetical protein